MTEKPDDETDSNSPADDPASDLVAQGIEAVGQSDAGKAEGFFRRAMSLGSVAAAYDLGTLMLNEQRYADAVRLFEELALHDDADALVNLGLAHRRLGQYREAEDAFRRAIAAGDTDAFKSLLNLFDEEGDSDAVISVFEEQLAAGNRSVLHDFGVYLLEHGDPDRAVGKLKESAEAGDHRSYANLAEALDQLGRVDEADEAKRHAGANDADRSQ